LKLLTMASSDSVSETFKLIWTVPTSHLEATKKAVFAAGAGIYERGKYIEVAFETKGQGQFKCGPDSNPHIGTAGGGLEKLEEYRVEIRCHGREFTRNAVSALKK